MCSLTVGSQHHRSLLPGREGRFGPSFFPCFLFSFFWEINTIALLLGREGRCGLSFSCLPHFICVYKSFCAYTFHLSITKDRAKTSCLKLCMYTYIYSIHYTLYIYIYISFIYHKGPCEAVLPKTLHVCIKEFVYTYEKCMHERICIHI